MIPNMMPITPQPREAVYGHQEGHRRAFGAPIHTPKRPDINAIAVKDHTLRRPVPSVDGAKFVPNSSTNLLFKDNNSTSSSTSDSNVSESPTLFTNHNLVSNTTAFSSPLFGNTHTTSSSMAESVNNNDTFIKSNPFSDSELEMEKLFDEYVVGHEDPSFLFTPQTSSTSFSHASLTPGLDTPHTIDLAQIENLLNSNTLGNQDFNLFGDSLGISTDDWKQTPLFNPASLADDPNALYASFQNNSTVTSASPQQFSFSSIGEDQLNTAETLPTPELSPSNTRKTSTAARRVAINKPVRRVSTAAPFTPITPAPTTPSTPQPVISRATKRRLPVIDEDPAVVEKRRRNTIAAQRSRARKAEEKAEDKERIAILEKEAENLRVLLSYWKDRACALGASPLEDGEI